MLAIDWAHTKDFAICNGKETKLVPWPEVMELAKQEDSAVIEHGAPYLYLYRLFKAVKTYTIPSEKVTAEREMLDVEKTDLTDAKIIYNLAARADGIRELSLNDKVIRLTYLYHQYLYAVKGLVATGNLMRSMRRHFGDDSNPTLFLLSMHEDAFQDRCESLKKEIAELTPEPPAEVLRIKGMSKWLWAGIIICADPRLFPTKSAYRKWCGLLDKKSINYKFNRNASRAYWLCADQFIRQRTPGWREIYDKAKEELSNRGAYSHPHRGAVNRLMTRFANYVYDVVKEKGVIERGTLW